MSASANNSASADTSAAATIIATSGLQTLGAPVTTVAMEASSLDSKARAGATKAKADSKEKVGIAANMDIPRGIAPKETGKATVLAKITQPVVTRAAGKATSGRSAKERVEKDGPLVGAIGA